MNKDKTIDVENIEFLQGKWGRKRHKAYVL